MKPLSAGLPFFWGTATSSHQIEGNNSANDWWAWEQTGKLKEASGLACDHFRRFREDIDLISKLGHNAYRFSLEWSRFEPQEGVWDDEAFKYYEEIFKELHARKIEPIVTLHHFTNPQWFADQGGWLSEKASFYFNRYVSRAATAYGKWVRFWITINEPLVYLYHSFFAGLWPPGIKSYRASMKVLRHQLQAHVEAYRTIHHIYETALKTEVWVSVAAHVGHFTPCRPGSFKDRWAVFSRSWFFNELFLNAATSGFLFFPGIYSEFLSGRKSLDFIGMNYYTRDFIRFSSWFGENSLGVSCDKAHHQKEVKELSMMGWEVHPEGLYEVLLRLNRYHLPIMITENGIATQDDGQRSRFILDHLGALRRAMKHGVPVLGYFYWSLLDNFEWAHGFDPRFGIVEVDYKNQSRKIKESAQVLTENCRKIMSEFEKK